MPDGDKNVGREVAKTVAKKIEKELGIPVTIIDNTTIDSITDTLLQDEEVKRLFTRKELIEEVSYFYQRLLFGAPGHDWAWVEDELKKFCDTLTVKKVYEAYIILEGIYNVPLGYNIFGIEIVKPDFDDELLKDRWNDLRNDVKYKKPKFNIDFTKCSWGKLTFKSVQTQELSELLYKELEEPFAVLSFIFNVELDVRNVIGLIHSANGTAFITPFEPMWRRDYLEHRDKELLDIFSKMTSKQTNLEKRILTSLQIYWLSLLSYNVEIKFLMLISACESLLHTKSDRDYLGYKLAEKTAFLLETEGQRRIELYRLMKEFYEKRSDLVHGGLKNITTDNVKTLKDIYNALVYKLLELSKTYDKMELRNKNNKDDKNGVDDYLEQLKFNYHEEISTP